MAGDPRGAAWLAQRAAERPDLQGDAQILWTAFCALQGDRPIGFSGGGTIPYTALREWAVDNGMPPGSDDFDWLHAGIDALMAEQLRHEEKRRDADAAKAKR